MIDFVFYWSKLIDQGCRCFAWWIEYLRDMFQKEDYQCCHDDDSTYYKENRY